MSLKDKLSGMVKSLTSEKANEDTPPGVDAPDPDDTAPSRCPATASRWSASSRSPTASLSRRAGPRRRSPAAGQSPSSSTARNASCGTSMRPTCFMRFLPAFCFSSSLRLREMSPP